MEWESEREYRKYLAEVEAELIQFRIEQQLRYMRMHRSKLNQAYYDTKSALLP